MVPCYRFLPLLLIVPAAALGQALPVTAYYAEVDTSDAVALRTTLHAAIRGHQRINYDTGANWVILEEADSDPNDATRILDFYGNASYEKDTDRASSYNREHMWPQSYGFPQSTDNISSQGYYPRTDMHALFLADSGYNSTRSNRWFDTVGTPRSVALTVTNNGVGGGPSTYPGNHNWYSTSTSSWEVWNARRGEAARALFYMDLRYEGGTHPITGGPEPDLVLTNNTALIQTTTASTAYMGVLSTLLTWHDQDPVSSQELHHMTTVAAAQRNRNPFVDYPEFVDCLFSGDCSGVPPINPQAIAALGRPGGAAITWAPRIETDLAGYNVYYAPTTTGTFTKANASLITATEYSITGLTDGTTYDLAVRAVDTDGNESRNSHLATITAGPYTDLIAESFELPPSPGTYTITGGTGNPALGDYFDRYRLGAEPSGFAVALAGLDQIHFIAGEDTNAAAPLPSNGIHTITFPAVDVQGFADLEAGISVGARALNVYDSAALSNGDYLRLFASFDGGPDQLVFQLTKVGPSASNGRLGRDINLDGLGDEELASYTELNRFDAITIPGAGDSLVLKVVTRFESGDEEIAFDDVRLRGIQSISGVTGWMLLH